MSVHYDEKPDRIEEMPTAVETVIVPRARDLGAFEVRRALPSAQRQMVGPFIFFDQVGPAEMPVGEGLDVRPHPHIGLSTVTYLFEGEIMHRDSLGFEQAIRPGDINWMTAGRGIAHSERSPQEARKGRQQLAGLQLWCAMPREDEERDPGFDHYGGADIPTSEGDGKRLRVMIGSGYGLTSPVRTFSDTIYADVVLEEGAAMPLDTGPEERAVYVLKGTIEIGGDVYESGRLIVFHPRHEATIVAREPAQLVIVGGEAMDGPRYIWWNFVSSSQERIEQAKADWKAGRFERVPGDDEFIPLPDS